MAESLIFTNENCVGCNRCISACSCPGATTAAVDENDKNIITVDGSKCISCGACLDACEHHARAFKDDSEAFFADLKRGEDISVMFAPAFIANYPDEYNEILGKLKTLGVNRFLSVAFGADITTWAYLNYISKYDFKGGISQPCPAVVDYIEKYIPELIEKLMPVQSPMMCAAIYARKHMNITGKMAFIGPCIAKKKEIESKRGKGLVSYSITFAHMMKYLKEMKIEPSDYTVESTSGLGSVYAMPGGLKENVHWFLGEDAFVRQVDGEKNMYRYLQENKDRILDKNTPYVLLDVLNCADGCLCGTGVEEDIPKEETLIRMMKIKKDHQNQERKSAWSSLLTPKERLDAFNEQFSELDLEDYLCSYDDNSSDCGWKYPNELELNIVFEDMNKNNEADRKINCGACGYNSCREMAVAIYNGFNHKANCIHYTKDIIETISVDTPTVLVIHTNNQTVHVVKYTGEESIRGWIESGLSHLNYNTAIKDYIDRYVDKNDKKRVWKEVEYSALCSHLEKNEEFSIIYTRHPEKGWSGYFQLNFSKKPEHNDIVLSFRNVDRLIRSEQEKEEKLQNALTAAEAANRTKSSFLANMSHEIRTPINAILGMDTMILRETDQDDIREYAGNVKTAGNTLLSLVNDILDFSKIESGKMEIIPGKYRLDSVINDLYNMVHAKVEEKGLDFELNVQSGIPSQLFGDEVRIKQIALNILNNAVKYTKKGKVAFSVGYEECAAKNTEKNDDNEKSIILKMEVADTGIGIKKEDMHILFSPYERLEEDKNKLIEGTGLGLAITRKLLEQMGSSLNVESEYGKGSVFSFGIKQTLWGSECVNENELLKAGRNDFEEKAEAFHAPDAEVLAVDDVQMNLEVLKNLLKRVKIKPDTCMSGKEAIELALKKKYDIIFLDAMMPGLSGEETLKEIRKNCTLNIDTPIIVLTANAIVGAREQYIEEGFTDYLSKPIDGDKLEKMTRDYLPKEKLVAVTGEEVEEEVVLSDDENKTLDILKGCSVFSVEKGIEASGDVKTYLNVTKNFYDTAGSRMDMIKDYFEAGDIENYTIQVHALKSSARLIGAQNLSEHAKSLEMAGKEGNKDKISLETLPLLEEYGAVTGALDKAFAEEEDLSKPQMPDKIFRKYMTDLNEIVDAFDMETADMLFTELEEYRFEKDDAVIYKKLKSFLAEVNRDEILNLLADYLK